MCRVEDEETGQIPKAYVVRAAGSELTEDQVIQLVASQVCLSPFFLHSWNHQNSMPVHKWILLGLENRIQANVHGQ